MRLSTECSVKKAPALRNPDEVLDALLQWVSLKHPQPLKVAGISYGYEGRIGRDIFFHRDFDDKAFDDEYQHLSS